jgi:hypothetical protein
LGVRTKQIFAARGSFLPDSIWKTVKSGGHSLAFDRMMIVVRIVVSVPAADWAAAGVPASAAHKRPKAKDPYRMLIRCWFEFKRRANFTSQKREILERVKGIEPSYSAWKAAALPLSYTRARRTICYGSKAIATALKLRIGG